MKSRIASISLKLSVSEFLERFPQLVRQFPQLDQFGDVCADRADDDIVIISIEHGYRNRCKLIVDVLGFSR